MRHAHGIGLSVPDADLSLDDSPTVRGLSAAGAPHAYGLTRTP